MRNSMVLLLILGGVVAALGLARASAAAVGSALAITYAVMALAGIGLILSLLAEHFAARSRRALLRSRAPLVDSWRTLSRRDV